MRQFFNNKLLLRSPDQFTI